MHKRLRTQNDDNIHLTSTPIFKLPDDVLLIIIRMVDHQIEKISVLLGVCRRLRAITQDNRIWAEVLPYTTQHMSPSSQDHWFKQSHKNPRYLLAWRDLHLNFNPNALGKYPEFANNPDIVLTCVGLDGLAIKHAAGNMQLDKTIAKAAVSTNGKSLEYFPAFQNNKEIVKLALQEIGCVFSLCSDGIKNDMSLLKIAIRSCSRAILSASVNIKSSYENILELLSINGQVLPYLSEGLRKDYATVLTAVKQSGFSLRAAAPSLQDNEDLVLAAIKSEGSALRYASAGLRNKVSVVVAAVTHEFTAYQYASLPLQSNKEVIDAALQCLTKRFTSKDWLVELWPRYVIAMIKKPLGQAFMQQHPHIFHRINEYANELTYPQMQKSLFVPSCALLIHVALSAKERNDILSKSPAAFRALYEKKTTPVI